MEHIDVSAVRASELSDESWTKIDTALGTPCRVRAKAYRFLSPSLVLARDGSCHDIDENTIEWRYIENVRIVGQFLASIGVQASCWEFG